MDEKIKKVEKVLKELKRDIKDYKKAKRDIEIQLMTRDEPEGYLVEVKETCAKDIENQMRKLVNLWT